MAAEARWTAMGSDAHVIVVGADTRLLDLARARIAQLERRWSRFLWNSEVSLLNRAHGRRLTVSSDTRLLVQHAVEAWHVTRGAFDPSVLGDVVRAGYDRPFAQLPSNGRRTESHLQRGTASIVVDDSGVRLPAGVGFDPGGIGKGLAADLVVAALLSSGADGACVNLGGDVRVAGSAPDGGSWRIDVDGPDTPGALGQVVLADGAVATSSRLRRRWQTVGEDRHHLIDPRTGRPARTDTAAVTVVAAHGWQAEVLAKSTFLSGAEEGFPLVDLLGGAAVSVDVDGGVRHSANWSSLTAGAAA